MLVLQLSNAKDLSLALNEISRRFGFWATLRALLAARASLARERRALHFLSDDLRHDIGLPVREREPCVLWFGPFNQWP